MATSLFKRMESIQGQHLSGRCPPFYLDMQLRRKKVARCDAHHSIRGTAQASGQAVEQRLRMAEVASFFYFQKDSEMRRKAFL